MILDVVYIDVALQTANVKIFLLKGQIVGGLWRNQSAGFS